MRSSSITLLLLSLSVLQSVHGHGYLKSPRSRNLRAYEEGVDPGQQGGSTTPLKDWCSHCVNRVGICGAADPGNKGFDYNNPKSVLGNVLPFTSQITYEQGQVIEIEHVITAHHKGHVELKACPISNDHDVPTQDCFDAFPLLFLEDELYGLLPDDDYRGRSYLDQRNLQHGSNPPGAVYTLKYRLPPNLNGEKILLQWWYVTGNTCRDVGYNDYKFPFSYPQLADCHQPLPWNGEVGGSYKPEQFWNCAEIKINRTQGAEVTPIPKPQGRYGETMPTPAPKVATSTPTMSPRNRCGSSWQDAVDNCRPGACVSNLDCDAGQFCFSSVGCSIADEEDDGSSEPGADYFVCGLDRIDAVNTCGAKCPSGKDGQCPPGQFCFKKVFECAPTSNKFCGTSKDDAGERCESPCSSDDDCPSGQVCHDDVTSCNPEYDDPSSTRAPSPGPVNANYCGKTWEDANYSCQQTCPNGTDDECDDPSHKCFSDCSGCLNNDDSGTNDPSAKFFCGTDWSNAADSCAQECPNKTDDECPSGQYCFKDTGCSTDDPPSSTKNYCGTTWEDATDKCTTSCPNGTDDECQAGEYCFADTKCDGNDNNDGNHNYCGTTWENANSQCATPCYSGTDDECPTGEYCFANCETCPKVSPPDGPSTSTPTVSRPTPAPVTRPPFAEGECNVQDKMTVNVGYYQSWAVWRDNCLVVHPRDIDVAGMGYTHLVYSFASVSADMKLEPFNGVVNEEGPRMLEMNALKQNHPSLKTFIAVGGWSHNDPGDLCHRFSAVAGTKANREKFASSVIDFLRTYNFDGIDFDWEYPADPNRCGKPEDKANYALLVEAVRNAMSNDSKEYLITMAIPITESTLERGYDLRSLANNLDWFNVMSYDIAGTWSAKVGSHTDMNAIRNGMQFILSKNVPSTSIVLGLAAYGRTFSLTDTSCTDIDCPFSGGRGGGCPVWDEKGYMAYDTILDIIESNKYKKLYLNEKTESMELVTDHYEFISFDSKETFSMKTSYAAEQCMRGYMWWAVDMIDEPFSVDVDPPTKSPSPTLPPATMAPFKQGPCDQDNKMSVNVGYYQSWAVWRNGCLVVHPNDLSRRITEMGYTHLIYSFASVSSSLTIEPWDGVASEEIPRMKEMNALKTLHPNLKTLIGIGGWTHNDPGRFCDRFTRVAATENSRNHFAASVVDFLDTVGFDGIDFDWEYPGDTNRCGKSEDKVNYGLLVQAVREAFVASNKNYLITMAAPISESALDRGYNLPHLAENLDWFNMMSYDIAGSWGSEVGSHTDMRFIKKNIAYILAQGVPSTSIVLGLGAYGRTFSLSDTNCMDNGCPFSGARGGGCPVWDEKGYMAYDTILDIVNSGSYKKYSLNVETDSMELVTNDYEFISFDSEETFSTKASYASTMCMRGYMWWAVDMIDESFSVDVHSPTVSPAPTVTSNPTPSPTVSKQPATSEPTGKPISGPQCASGHTGWVPYLECTHYHYCSNGDVVGVPYACPAGTLFNVSLQSCDWIDNVVCPLSNPTASPVPSTTPPTEGPNSDPKCTSGATGWFPHQQCTQFFYCRNGQQEGETHTCPDGTLWNVKNGTCDWDYNVDCQSPSTAAPTSSPSVEESDTPSAMPSSISSSKPSSAESDSPSSIPSPVSGFSPMPSLSPSLVPTLSPSSVHSLNPTGESTVSPAPSGGNLPPPLSWHISEISEPIILTNDKDQKVIQFQYNASNRKYGVKVFQKDCKTDSEVPSLTFSDSISSPKGFIDIKVDLTVNQSEIEKSEIWDDEGFFNFCLSTFLLSEGMKVVVLKNDIFKVHVNNLAGFSLGNIDINPQSATTHDDLTLQYGGTVNAHECDPETMDPVNHPAPHGPLDILHICLKQTEMEEFVVRSIETLTIEGLVKFDYIVDGSIPYENKGLVSQKCEGGICMASVQLLNEFFLSENVDTLQATGAARLKIEENSRTGQEVKGSYSMPIGIEKPCREKRSKITTYLTKILQLVP